MKDTHRIIPPDDTLRDAVKILGNQKIDPDTIRDGYIGDLADEDNPFRIHTTEDLTKE